MLLCTSRMTSRLMFAAISAPTAASTTLRMLSLTSGPMTMRCTSRCMWRTVASCAPRVAVATIVTASVVEVRIKDLRTWAPRESELRPGLQARLGFLAELGGGSGHAGLIAFPHFVHERHGGLQHAHLASQGFEQTFTRGLAAGILL